MFRQLGKIAARQSAASARRSLIAATPMSLFRRSPFGDFDWLFSDPFFTAVPAAYQLEAAPAFDSRLTAQEIDNGVQVELEVPRYRPEDIKVNADAKTGVITVTGKLAAPPQGQGKGAHTTSSVPAFTRSFTASSTVFDLAKVTSSVEHGLLKVTIPRLPQEPPKQVEAPKAEKVLPIESKPTESKEIAQVIPRSWPPKIEVKEKPADGVAVSFTLALPSSVKPENIKLRFVEPHGLRVEAAYSVKKQTSHGYEQHSASFSRFLNLPEKTTPENVTTKFENGQLKIDVAEGKAK